MDDTGKTWRHSLAGRAFLVVWRFYVRLADIVDELWSGMVRRILPLRGRVFDDDWYLEQNPDVFPYKDDLFGHFLKSGRFEKRNARFFDAAWYFKAHRDIWMTRVDAWTHYRLYGLGEGRVARFWYVSSVVERPKMPLYKEWLNLYARRKKSDASDARKITHGLKLSTRFDVFMHITAHAPGLDLALKGLREQGYPHARFFLLVAEAVQPDVQQAIAAATEKDGRFVIETVPAGMSEAAAVNRSRGLGDAPYMVRITARDVLTPEALFWVAYQLHQSPEAALLYSDEDRLLPDGELDAGLFKPKFNYELFLTHNFIGDFLVVRRDVFEQVGGFDEGLPRDWDYDLVWRLHDTVGPHTFVHIPRALFHIYTTEDPVRTAALPEVLKRHFARTKRKAKILPVKEAQGYNRVRFTPPVPAPLVSIIIPTRDRVELLKQVIDSLLTKTTWPNFEIIIVDNDSREAQTRSYFNSLSDPRIRVLPDPRPFNFSALNNNAVREAKGEFVCLMNNDIEIITPDWIEEMLSFAALPGAGCVGARLWYPDDTIQHAGVLVGFHGVAGHMHKFLPKGETGYADRAVLHQSLSAVTAAVLMIRRETYLEVGGFDEALAVAFNDVDFCLKVRDAGYRNIYTPYAEMYHHESASRGAEDSPEKKKREMAEINLIKERYGERMMHDPAYNPNLSLTSENLAYGPPRLPTLRELAAPVKR